MAAAMSKPTRRKVSQPTGDIPPFIRPAAAAQICAIGRRWIYARIADGSLPAVKLAGRAVRIKREDLLEFIKGQ